MGFYSRYRNSDHVNDFVLQCIVHIMSMLLKKNYYVCMHVCMYACMYVTLCVGQIKEILKYIFPILPYGQGIL